MLDWLKRLTGTGTKALTTTPPASSLSGGFAFGHRRIDFERAVGDGLESSVVMAPVMWIARTFPEAPLAVYDTRGGQRVRVPGHALERLVERPNDAYAGVTLWFSTLVSFLITGNAYWLIVRDSTLRPVALWYAPPSSIAPRWKDGEYVGWYEYRPQGPAIRLEVDDVVHLRHGINPRNVRLGLSPLAAELRSIFTDDEAGRYTAAILHNMGVPGLVISPAGDAVSDDEARATKAMLEERVTGENRGRPIVLTGKTQVVAFGFSPRDMDLSAIRNVSEERICAALGVPAAVVGFGSGLESTKVGATLRELVGLAWSGCLIPLQRIIASQVAHKLLPEFEASPERFAVDFDRSKVSALQEDEGLRAARWNSQVQAGVAMVSEARRAFNLPVAAADDVFLRPLSTVEVASRPARPAVAKVSGVRRA